MQKIMLPQIHRRIFHRTTLSYRRRRGTALLRSLWQYTQGAGLFIPCSLSERFVMRYLLGTHVFSLAHIHLCFHVPTERQFVHDGIIDDYLESSNEDVPENAKDSGISWLILTVGPKGAGKQHVLRELVESGHLPITSAGLVRVDQDDIRRCLPEYDWYLSHAPEIVADMTRQEAGYIAETLCLAGLRGGKTVVWDSALGNVDWYASRIIELIHMIPCLKVSMMHITATLDQIQERCRKGAEITGRTLSPSIISETAARVPENVERMKRRMKFDFFCTINNGDDVLDIDGDQDFGVFSSDPAPISSRTERQSTRLSLVTSDFGAMGENRRASYKVSRIDGTDKEGTDDPRTHRKSFKRSARRVASYTKSTEQNHKSNDMNFYGRFAHIRKTLDYEYHCNYTFERQKIQDTIVLEFLQNAIIKDKDGELCTTPTEPWLCFTAGKLFRSSVCISTRWNPIHQLIVSLQGRWALGSRTP